MVLVWGFNLPVFVTQVSFQVYSQVATIANNSLMITYRKLLNTPEYLNSTLFQIT